MLQRESLKTATRLVVKLGTGVLTDGRKQLDLIKSSDWSCNWAAQRNAGKEIVIVTSGAVGAGMGALGTRSGRPAWRNCSVRRVGQSRLMPPTINCFRRPH